MLIDLETQRKLHMVANKHPNQLTAHFQATGIKVSLTYLYGHLYYRSQSTRTICSLHLSLHGYTGTSGTLHSAQFIVLFDDLTQLKLVPLTSPDCRKSPAHVTVADYTQRNLAATALFFQISVILVSMWR